MTQQPTNPYAPGGDREREANGAIRPGHAADRYLVVITEQDPYAFAVETLADAAAALNRENPVWGGFVLERTEDGSSFRSADVYLDEDSGTYRVGQDGWEGNEELAAEHREGLHADTARQDCPLCPEEG